MNTVNLLKKKIMFTFTVLALVLPACAKDNSPVSNSGTVLKQSVPEGDDSYESYFNRFLFKAGPCAKDNSRYYNFASTESISQLASNSNLYFSIDRLYLLSESNYEVEINLLKPRPDLSDSTFEILKTYNQNGKWSVVNDAIVLENLGVGHALTYNGHRAIDLTLTSTVANGTFNQSKTILTNHESIFVPRQLEAQCL